MIQNLPGVGRFVATQPSAFAAVTNNDWTHTVQPPTISVASWPPDAVLWSVSFIWATKYLGTRQYFYRHQPDFGLALQQVGEIGNSAVAPFPAHPGKAYNRGFRGTEDYIRNL